MTRHLLLLAALGACACPHGHATIPKPTFTPALPATVLDEPVLTTKTAAAWSTGYEATSNVPTTETTFQRQDLDVATVVSLVRERLSSVAVLAVADALAAARVRADRPWARDLLRLTAKLAIARSADWRPVAEGTLRVIARVLLADAVVRTSASGTDADRQVLTDWGYWYLAQIDLLRDPEVLPPTCAAASVVCKAIRDNPADQGGSMGAIEARLHISAILDGARLVARLRAAHADSKLSATVLLDQLLRAKSLGSFAPLMGVIGNVETSLAELRSLEPKLLALERSRQYLVAVMGSTTSTTTDLKNAAAQMLAALQVTVTIDGTTISIQHVLEKVGGDRAVDAYDALVEALKAMSTAGVDVRLLKIVLNAYDVQVAPVNSKDLDELSASLDELKQLLGPDPLEKLDVTRAADLIASMTKVVSKLHLDGFAAISAKFGQAQRELRQQLRGVTVLLDQLRSLADLAASDTLGKVYAAIVALRGIDNGKVITPVLDVLAPVLDKLADGRALTSADIFAAISDAGPADLVRALGPGFDLDHACADDASWQCWSVRLAMSVHGSLKFDGKTVSVDSDAMIASLAKLGTETRRTKPGSVHLLASVGTGTLYTAKQWRPLVAEQLGASMILFGNHKATVSLGAFGSGILYRFVLDDNVSDGVMLGGTALLRIYDMVELHADITAVIVPEAMNGGHTHVGFIMGIQVPLGDYLERLKN